MRTIRFLAASMLAITLASAAIAAPPSTIDRATQKLRGDYRQQQWSRLSRQSDKDSLIAAVYLGIATESEPKAIDGHADVERRLSQQFGGDAEALFALSLACQWQSEPCAVADAADRLAQLAPDNTVHWLLRPNGDAPDAAALHHAAAATQAQTRQRELVGRLRAALADQPAPKADAGIDATALAAALRRDTIEQVPLPKFAGYVHACKAPPAALREDCLTIGRRLMADRDGTILTRMIGSATVRRLAKGTPDADEAYQLRRDYVWLSDQLDANDEAAKERLQNDVVSQGEWAAWQSAATRLGKAARAPKDWTPSNPQTLLLSEDRTPPAAK